METTNLQPLLVTKQHAARLLSLSLRTLDNLMVRKELYPVRVGSRVLFQMKELHRFAQYDHSTMAEAA